MGFANDVIGGAAALIRAAIKSPNYQPGTSGWSINKDGSAEFRNIVIVADGTSGKILVYSGPPAAGNLIISVSGAGGTDSYGNTYVQGIEARDASGNYISLSSASITFKGVANSPIFIFENNVGQILQFLGALGYLFDKPIAAVQPGTTSTPETWHPIPYVNGWGNQGTTDASNVFGQYRLTDTNEVEIIGVISGAAASSNTMFTLPAGYRPSSQQGFRIDPTAAVSGLVSSWLQVTGGSGVVTVQTPGNASGYKAVWIIHGFFSMDA